MGRQTQGSPPPHEKAAHRSYHMPGAIREASGEEGAVRKLMSHAKFQEAGQQIAGDSSSWSVGFSRLEQYRLVVLFFPQNPFHSCSKILN